MPSKGVVQSIAAIVVLVFAVGIVLSGGTVDSAWLKFYSWAVIVATGLLWLWDKLLWRLALVQRIPSVPRNLRGTWKGELHSLWVDPATHQRPAPKTVFLVVRQTWSSVSATLITDESISKSVLGSLSGDDGDCYLSYSYLNRPDSSVEHRSRIHNGATMLQVVGRPVTRLRGRYWTDRDSRGELDFTERQNETAEDFESAGGLFS
jgi:hypothetical protein